MSEPYATGRLFIRGKKVSEWPVDKVNVFDIHRIMTGLMTEFPGFPSEPHMIEIEFHTLPEAERFTRFGTDPSMMAVPYQIKNGRFN